MKNISFYLFLFLFFSCGGEEYRNALRYEVKSYEESRCVEEVCASMSLSYPTYFGHQVDSSINGTIESLITGVIAFEEPAETMALAVSNYLDSFEKFSKEYGSFSDWFIDIDVQETFQNEELLTILLSSSSFLGGAHPNSYQSIINFDIKRGEIVPLKGLKMDFGMLLELVEQKFRIYHEVAEGISLEEDGRFFLNNDQDFFLPGNMGFDKNGLLVIYNPYDIGPYVLGMTVIHLSWQELDGIVSPELKLK